MDTLQAAVKAPSLGGWRSSILQPPSGGLLQACPGGAPDCHSLRCAQGMQEFFLGLMATSLPGKQEANGVSLRVFVVGGGFTASSAPSGGKGAVSGWLDGSTLWDSLQMKPLFLVCGSDIVFALQFLMVLFQAGSDLSKRRWMPSLASVWMQRPILEDRALPSSLFPVPVNLPDSVTMIRCICIIFITYWVLCKSKTTNSIEKCRLFLLVLFGGSFQRLLPIHCFCGVWGTMWCWGLNLSLLRAKHLLQPCLLLP